MTSSGWHFMGDTIRGTPGHVTKCIGISIVKKMGIFFYGNHFLEPLGNQNFVRIGTHHYMNLGNYQVFFEFFIFPLFCVAVMNPRIFSVLVSRKLTVKTKKTHPPQGTRLTYNMKIQKFSQLNGLCLVQNSANTRRGPHEPTRKRFLRKSDRK